MLPHIGNDRKLLEQLKRNWREANLDELTRAILGFAEQITRDAPSIRESDIETLRKKGLSDEQILDVVLIASHFNMVNRISTAIGVKPPVAQ